MMASQDNMQQLPGDSDLVDRIFQYIREEFPHLDQDALEQKKIAVRAEFAGIEVYIPVRTTSRGEMARKVLSLFNGRNATEVARRLGISRATVYRLLKQPGGITPSQISEK